MTKPDLYLIHGMTFEVQTKPFLATVCRSFACQIQRHDGALGGRIFDEEPGGGGSLKDVTVGDPNSPVRFKKMGSEFGHEMEFAFDEISSLGWMNGSFHCGNRSGRARCIVTPTTIDFQAAPKMEAPEHPAAAAERDNREG